MYGHARFLARFKGPDRYPSTKNQSRDLCDIRPTSRFGAAFSRGRLAEGWVMREKHGCPMVEILVEQAQKSLWGVASRTAARV